MQFWLDIENKYTNPQESSTSVRILLRLKWPPVNGYVFACSLHFQFIFICLCQAIPFVLLHKYFTHFSPHFHNVLVLDKVAALFSTLMFYFVEAPTGSTAPVLFVLTLAPRSLPFSKRFHIQLDWREVFRQTAGVPCLPQIISTDLSGFCADNWCFNEREI